MIDLVRKSICRSEQIVRQCGRNGVMSGVRLEQSIEKTVPHGACPRAAWRIRGGWLFSEGCLGLRWMVLATLLSLALGVVAEVREGDELFTTDDVIAIQIEVPAKGLKQLQSRGWTWGGTGRERPEVEVTVRDKSGVYTNVAMHLKGAAGSFQPVDSKPGLTLNFDKFIKGQRFHGLQKISLNNSVQDPSYLTEKICRELFTAAGVPAPRADYATVELNGRKLGLYVLLEGYNRQFLKRHFKSGKGRLYDGGFLRDVDSPAAQAPDAVSEDRSTLRPLVDAANDPETTSRFSRLAEFVDMDRFISFLAMETLVCHWDGYSMNKNNYRVYHDLETDRVVFMPHGMDQMFGVMMVPPALSVLPPLQGLVAKAVRETSEGRRRYFQRLRQLNASIFDVERITNRIQQCVGRVQPILTQLDPSMASQHRLAVDDLCERIAIRKQSLDEQLAGGQGIVPEFDSAGVAKVSGWAAKTNAGIPVVQQSRSSEGSTVLQLAAGSSPTIASWRVKVLLESGHYSFAGRMRTQGVSSDPRDKRAGAGLRVDKKPAWHKTLGDTDWKEVSYEFDVADGLFDIELVCELRASQGQVWFDADSLRLIRQ